MQRVFKRLHLFLFAFLLFCTAGCVKGTEETDVADTNADFSIHETLPKETENEWREVLAAMSTDAIFSTEFTLPSDSTECSTDFAMQVLSLCTGHTAEKQKAILEAAGFEILTQVHYEKELSEASHTCAYTVAARSVLYHDEKRPLISIMIRGTEGGEWYSNMDFAPSQSEDAQFSENFLFAAEDIFVSLQPILASYESPLLLIGGHSRGGACAGLLGMLLNPIFGTDNIFTYTFASPSTCRTDMLAVDTDNIFNFINPADLVTKLPLQQWGYSRLGTDILLPTEMDSKQQAEEMIEVLQEIAPSISAYYKVRHSLSSSGTAEDGMTPFALLLLLTNTFLERSTTASDDGQPVSFSMEGISPESDFAPLFALLQDATADGGKLGASILKEHLPATYYTLLESYASANTSNPVSEKS